MGDEHMSRKWRNILIGVLVAALVIVGIVLLNRTPDNYKAKYEGVDLSTDVTGIGRSNTYGAYVAQYADLPAVTETVEVDLEAFEGKGGKTCSDGVMTEDESELTWKVEVPQAGLYNIRLDYLTTESRGIDIERELAINGKVPFSGASTLCFSRLWKSARTTRGMIFGPPRRKFLRNRAPSAWTTWVTRLNLTPSILKKGRMS